MDFSTVFHFLSCFCVCGACHSFLLYAIWKGLGPSFSCYFFRPLPFRPWLSTCFKELLILILCDPKIANLDFMWSQKWRDILWHQVVLRFFFFSINRLLAQCYSKQKWRYKGYIRFFKYKNVTGIVWSSPGARVTSDGFK